MTDDKPRGSERVQLEGRVFVMKRKRDQRRRVLRLDVQIAEPVLVHGFVHEDLVGLR